jgi:hypothetical protein
MSDPVKNAWSDVAEEFSKVGKAMKERYHSSEQDRDSRTNEANVSDGGLREAFERLVAAGRDVGERTIDVVRDADVNAQAKQAASSLNDALSATVDMIGREVAGWFGRAEAADDEPAVVGVPPDVPETVRPSTTGLVTGPVEEPPDVVVADVDGDHGPAV